MATDTINNEGGEQIPLSHDKACIDDTIILVFSSKDILRLQLGLAAENRRGDIIVLVAGEVERKEREKNLNMSGMNVRFLSLHNAKLCLVEAIDKAFVLLDESEDADECEGADESEDADESDQHLGIVLMKTMKLLAKRYKERFGVVKNERKKVGGDLVKLFVVKDELARLVVQYALQPDTLESVTESLGSDEGISLSFLNTFRLRLRSPWQSSEIEGSPHQTGDAN